MEVTKWRSLKNDHNASFINNVNIALKFNFLTSSRLTFTANNTEHSTSIYGRMLNTQITIPGLVRSSATERNTIRKGSTQLFLFRVRDEPPLSSNSNSFPLHCQGAQMTLIFIGYKKNDWKIVRMWHCPQTPLKVVVQGHRGTFPLSLTFQKERN